MHREATYMPCWLITSKGNVFINIIASLLTKTFAKRFAPSVTPKDVTRNVVLTQDLEFWRLYTVAALTSFLNNSFLLTV